MNNNKKTIIALILIVLIAILLYLLILKFGNIENHGPMVPTGNIDIFEIDCGCGDCKANTKPVSGEDVISKNEPSQKSNSKSNPKTNDTTNESSIPVQEEEPDEESNMDLSVYDDYKIWDNKELRIFSNPAYEYDDIIAPGSMNTYSFIIRNDNQFDIDVDIFFKEDNKKNINMKYKLRSMGEYIIGSENNYTFINGMKVEKVRIPAKSQVSYMLDWKWIDNYNDTNIGFDVDSNIKLSINIGANEV